MKKNHLLLIVFMTVILFCNNMLYGQGMALNSTGTQADTSAMLDIGSTTKGMLTPRMTTSQRTAISLPAKGLLVFDITLNAFYFNSGTSTSPVWSPIGGNMSAGSAAGEMMYWNGTNWLGTGAGRDGQFLTFISGTPTWVTLPFFSITASSGSNGTISPAGITMVCCAGGTKVYTIAPTSGYRINNVFVDGSTVGAVTTYTFTSVSSNHTISATFIPDTYPIVASSGSNGTVSPAGTTDVAAGTNQIYTMIPTTGYRVDDVTVDGSSVGAVNTYTFTAVATSHTISATFIPDTYPIVASSGANGTVSPTGTTNVTFGNNQVYTITPSAGYGVADVLVDGSSVGAVTSYTFTSVGASHTISATFSILTYPIVATSGSNGTVSPAGTTNVSHGGTQVYTMTPSSGYRINTVTVDGSSVGAVSTYTFTPVTSSHTIGATFAAITYSLVATVSGSGTISPSGTTVVTAGTTQVYTVTPGSAGYGYLTVDGVTQPMMHGVSTYTFTSVGANHTISASFRGLQIGDNYAGGIVTYLSSADHGMVSSINDLSTSATWGCYNTANIAGTLLYIGNGAANTALILSGCTTTGIAAELCHSYTGGGYSDWYLPARYELELLITNRASVSAGAVAAGGSSISTANIYWSSTQFNIGLAWDVPMNGSGAQNVERYLGFYVRAFRSF